MIFFNLQLITIISFSADIIPSTTPADQRIVPSASASQRQEITLKQVSHMISIFHHQYLIIK